MVNITLPGNLTNITGINTVKCWQVCINPDYTVWIGVCIFFLLISYFDINSLLKERLKIDDSYPGFIRYIFKHDFWVGMALNILLFFFLLNLFYA